MTDWTKVLALHLMAQEEAPQRHHVRFKGIELLLQQKMDMSDPSVQQMLDDDRAEALAQWRSIQQEEEDNYQKGE